jgi:hypothetical protein
VDHAARARQLVQQFITEYFLDNEPTPTRPTSSPARSSTVATGGARPLRRELRAVTPADVRRVAPALPAATLRLAYVGDRVADRRERGAAF